ncbi:hypothetical protein [Methylocystis hirsuta]|uniref:hypothetical protein n=1 Tax=Methylocystis hirsuta TaxID=369798 RepID=UPI0011CED091|nr:hypothetical protein [Methylocystis hirsuta]
MAKNVQQIFESTCLSIDLGFYYKHASKKPWNDIDELLQNVIADALAPYDRSELITLRDCLDQLLSSNEPAEVLTETWNRMKPLTAFFGDAEDASADTGIVHVFKQVRRAIEEKLTTAE